MKIVQHIPSYQKWQGHLESLVIVLSIVILATGPFFNNFSMKLHLAVSILSAIFILFTFKNRDYKLVNLLLPGSILLLGVLDTIWYKIFKSSDSPFISTYHNYQNTGKVFIFGFFPVLLASTTRIKENGRIIDYLLYSLSFVLLAATIYIKSTTNLSRLDFGIGTATGAAYTTVIIGFISSWVILSNKLKNLILYIINNCCIFSILIHTETRSALLIYTVITITFCVWHFRKNKRGLIFAVGILAVLTSASLFITKDTLTQRYNDAIYDINLYNNDNSKSSLGARLSMYEAGIKLLRESPLEWRSAESRNDRIKEYARVDPIFLGAAEFTNIHLHNELIESASIKGLAGLLSTLLFYSAGFWLGFSRKSSLIIGLMLTISGLGLSDVLLWARNIPVIIIAAFTTAIFIPTRLKSGKMTKVTLSTDS